MKTSRRELVENFLSLYRQTGKLLFTEMQRVLQQEPDCPMATMAILKVLKDNGALTQHEIARELHHSDAAISRQITVLEERGYISTQPDAINKRATVITMTASGKRTIDTAMRRLDEHFFEILAPLSDEQFTQLIGLTTELQNTLLNSERRPNESNQYPNR